MMNLRMHLQEVVWPNRRTVPSIALKLGKIMKPSVGTEIRKEQINNTATPLLFLLSGTSSVYLL